VGPSQADMPFPMMGVGPLQGGIVEPTQAVLISRDMYEAAERSEQRLGLPVNPVLCSRERWLAKADPLIQQVRTAPVVWVVGKEPQQEGDE
jgi:hypothetical protein